MDLPISGQTAATRRTMLSDTSSSAAPAGHLSAFPTLAGIDESTHGLSTTYGDAGLASECELIGCAPGEDFRGSPTYWRIDDSKADSEADYHRAVAKGHRFEGSAGPCRVARAPESQAAKSSG